MPIFHDIMHNTVTYYCPDGNTKMLHDYFAALIVVSAIVHCLWAYSTVVDGFIFALELDLQTIQSELARFVRCSAIQHFLR